MQRGLRWMLNMQSRNGGWGAFDVDNVRELWNEIPFADMKAMLDAPTADLTGRALEILGHFGYSLASVQAERALRFVTERQEADGSWWGRWGVNHIYGTWSVLTGLRKMGFGPSEDRMRRGADWLEARQNADGGFGESPGTYDEPAARGQGPSSVSQTAWALMGLVAAGRGGSASAQRAVDYLRRAPVGRRHVDRARVDRNRLSGALLPALPRLPAVLRAVGARPLAARSQQPERRVSTGARLEADLRSCEALARSHYENFAIGSRLLPRSTRRWLAAIYAIVREADDLADEGEVRTEEQRQERIAALDAWELGLEAAAAGGDAPHFAQRAAGEAVRALDLPLAPFRALFRAFRRDLVQTRYETFEDLLSYCRESANPVGELVLRLFGRYDEKLRPASDAICTGLQLVNHWQDVASDARRGRVYVPLEDLTRFGLGVETLLAAEDSAALRQLLAFETGRARALLEEGGELLGQVRGRLRVEVALFRRGGLAACDALARASYAVQPGPPRLLARDRVSVVIRALRDAAAPPRPPRAVEALHGA